MRKKAQKNISIITLEPFSGEVEEHLNAAVLEHRGESKEEGSRIPLVGTYTSWDIEARYS